MLKVNLGIGVQDWIISSQNWSGLQGMQRCSCQVSECMICIWRVLKSFYVKANNLCQSKDWWIAKWCANLIWWKVEDEFWCLKYTFTVLRQCNTKHESIRKKNMKVFRLWYTEIIDNAGLLLISLWAIMKGNVVSCKSIFIPRLGGKGDAVTKYTATTTKLPVINIFIVGTEFCLCTTTFENYCHNLPLQVADSDAFIQWLLLRTFIV